MTGGAKRFVRPRASPGLGLIFADGRRWAIRALDAQAEATVLELGRVMRLGPAQGGRELCVVSRRSETRSRRVAAGRRLTCRLGPTSDRLTEVLRMEQVANTIAVQSLVRGGLLLHGALAVRDGVGFILAGPSGVGKSFASRRLPSPWRSLSDDCALVVRNANGRYWAHPWPTWSLLRDNGPVKSWPVEQAVPLKALLFLRQSPLDRAEPIAATPATAMIVESAVRLARSVLLTRSGDGGRATCRKYVRAARTLAAAVPAFRLHISLTGKFWDELERVSAERCQPSTVSSQPSASSCEPPAVSRPSSGGRKPRLICFRARSRTFLKLVVGGRVVGSVNDAQSEWHVRRPFRRLVNGQALREAVSLAFRSGMRG